MYLGKHKYYKYALILPVNPLKGVKYSYTTKDARLSIVIFENYIKKMVLYVGESRLHFGEPTKLKIKTKKLCI